MATKKTVPKIPSAYSTLRAPKDVKKFMDFNDDGSNALCLCCGKYKPVTDFFKSPSVLYKAIGHMPVCKECLNEIFEYYKQRNSDERAALYYFCRLVDIAFFEDIYIDVAGSPNLLGKYMQRLNSVVSKSRSTKFDDSNDLEIKKSDEEVVVYVTDGTSDSIKITPEIQKRWQGCNADDIPALEQFYQDIARDNKVESAQEIYYLKATAKTYVAAENALRLGDTNAYRVLSSDFNAKMKDFKMRPADKSTTDRSGGMRTFSEIYAEVEKPSFIPPWKKRAPLLGANQDIVDKTIMHIENFTLRHKHMTRMATPPADTPKIEDWELDPKAKEHANYVEIKVEEDEDVSGTSEKDAG